MNLLETIGNTATKIFGKLSDTQGKHLTPIALLTLNGQAFGVETNARIISIEITDKRGFEADELSVELNDYDGAIAIPNVGDTITLDLGYRETGMVSKGVFKFAEFTHQGAPDTLSITARAADLADTLAEQREKSWHKQTLFQIVETIAKANGYTGDKCKIAEQYQKIDIIHIDQTDESDANFLSRLAEQYGAIATVKHGIFLFIPIGTAQTANGTNIPLVEITRQSGDSHSFSYDAANAYNAVRAYYTDKQTGKKIEVVISKDNLQAEKKIETKQPQKGKQTEKTTTKTVTQTRKIDTNSLKIKTLRNLYATETGAYSGARNAFKKLLRGAAQFSLTLAVGRPDLFPETPVVVRGFKPEIDRESWLITEVQHRLDDSGYTCSLKLEAQINLDEDSDTAPAETARTKDQTATTQRRKRVQEKSTSH